MDNLTSHHNAQVSALIHTAGHRLVFRAPYYPVDGPIEYVFNSLQVALWINMHQIRTEASLLHEVHTAIANTCKHLNHISCIVDSGGIKQYTANFYNYCSSYIYYYNYYSYSYCYYY